MIVDDKYANVVNQRFTREQKIHFTDTHLFLKIFYALKFLKSILMPIF